MTAISAYGLLMLSAFLSATVLPGSSEAVLLGFLAAGKGDPLLLFAVATISNVAGSVVNFCIGWYAQRFKGRPWFPLSDATNARAQRWFARYGLWSLLLSWVPVVGDPLTLIAGIMRINFWWFLLLVSIGKVLRYTFVLGAWELWTH